MNKVLIFVLICFSMNVFGQNEPLPPQAPVTDETLNDSIDNSPETLYGIIEKKKYPEFSIPLSESTNPSSIYYHKTIEDRINKLDTTQLSEEQLISYTKFQCTKKGKLSPTELDKLANKAYKLNDEKKYEEVVKTSKLILSESPNNITGHKEISLAYRKLGQDSLSKLHFNMMVKIINSVFKYGDGTYKFPFIVNNFFEGISIYEAYYRCKPQKMVLMLDKTNRLLGAYNGYSSVYDEIFIRYSLLTHWKPELKKDDYIIEK